MEEKLAKENVQKKTFIEIMAERRA